MMTLRHIQVFHAVYQTGSLSSAARWLGISQPSVSKILRHAETRLGFTLFGVVKGRLVATGDAHALFGEARDVQARVEAFHEAARNLKRVDRGNVRLAAVHSLGLHVLPAAMSLLLARFPHVSFDIKTLHTAELPNALHERSSDVVIAYDVPRSPRFVHTRLGSGELVTLFRRRDLPAPPERVSLSMFAGQRLIRIVNAGAVGMLTERHIGEAEATGVPSRISVHTYFVAAALVRQGLGISVMDEFTARACLTPELDFRPLVDGIDFDVFAIHLEDRPIATAATHLLDCVRTVLDTL